MALEVNTNTRSPECDSPEKPASRAAVIWLLVVVIASIAPYVPTLSGGFVLDDQYLIAEDPMAHGLANAGKAFTTRFLHAYAENASPLYYRPLVTLSYQANYSLSGADPLAFRLTNLLLGVLASLLVFALARRLTGSLIAAGCAGVAFGVLPSHVQVIAWIAGRTDLISTLFVLGGFLAFVAAYRRGEAFNWPLALLCSLMFACGLLSKESAAVLPALCAVYVWVFGPRSRRDELAKWAALAFVPLIVYLIARNHVLGTVVDCSDGLVIKERVLRVGAIYATYLRMLFVPREPRAFYGNLEAGMHFTPLDYAALAIPIAMIAAAILARRRLPVVSFAIAWVFLALLPASDLIPTRTVLPMDRFVFMASVGSSLLLGWLVWRMWEFRPVSVRTWPIAVVALVLIYAIYSAATLASGGLSYRSNLTWARMVARQNPPYDEFHLLAAGLLQSEGCVTESAGEYEAAIALSWERLTNDQRARLESHLGEVYATSGEMEKAAAAFSKAVQARPDLGHVWRDLARADLRLERYDRAAAEFERAFSLIKPSPNDRYELGLTYVMLGNRDRARPQLDRVIAGNSGTELADRARRLLASSKPVR